MEPPHNREGRPLEYKPGPAPEIAGASVPGDTSDRVSATTASTRSAGVLPQDVLPEQPPPAATASGPAETAHTPDRGQLLPADPIPVNSPTASENAGPVDATAGSPAKGAGGI